MVLRAALVAANCAEVELAGISPVFPNTQHNIVNSNGVCSKRVSPTDRDLTSTGLTQHCLCLFRQIRSHELPHLAIVQWQHLQLLLDAETPTQTQIPRRSHQGTAGIVVTKPPNLLPRLFRRQLVQPIEQQHQIVNAAHLDTAIDLLIVLMFGIGGCIQPIPFVI